MREPSAPPSSRHCAGAHRGLDHRHPAATGQRLDRELDEALTLARPRPGEGKALALLHRLDGSVTLVVPVADSDLAALVGIELDIGSEPLLEAILVGERLPDLLRGSLDQRLALDP